MKHYEIEIKTRESELQDIKDAFKLFIATRMKDVELVRICRIIDLSEGVK